MSEDKYAHKVGVELYHLLKGGAPVELTASPAVQFHQETKRVIRSYPDGTVDIAEHIITDEIVS